MSATFDIAAHAVQALDSLTNGPGLVHVTPLAEGLPQLTGTPAGGQGGAHDVPLNAVPAHQAAANPLPSASGSLGSIKL